MGSTLYSLHFAQYAQQRSNGRKRQQRRKKIQSWFHDKAFKESKQHKEPKWLDWSFLTWKLLVLYQSVQWMELFFFLFHCTFFTFRSYELSVARCGEHRWQRIGRAAKKEEGESWLKQRYRKSIDKNRLWIDEGVWVHTRWTHKTTTATNPNYTRPCICVYLTCCSVSDVNRVRKILQKLVFPMNVFLFAFVVFVGLIFDLASGIEQYNRGKKDRLCTR